MTINIYKYLLDTIVIHFFHYSLSNLTKKKFISCLKTLANTWAYTRRSRKSFSAAATEKKSWRLLDTLICFKKRNWKSTSTRKSYLNLYHHARLHIQTVLDFLKINFFLYFCASMGRKRDIELPLMRDTSDIFYFYISVNFDVSSIELLWEISLSGKNWLL